MASSHLGESIAAMTFDIELETSGSRAAIDGRFMTGNLQGKTVNIKWYLKREGMLDITTTGPLDYHLVMTGRASSAASSHASTRPWSYRQRVRRGSAGRRPASPRRSGRELPPVFPIGGGTRPRRSAGSR
jgi:hypothetical protein